MRFSIAFIVALVVLLNLGCAAIELSLLRRRGTRWRWFEALICFWALAMSGLGVLQVYLPTEWKPFVREWLYFPLAVEMVWNVLFLQVYFLLLVLATLAIRLFRPIASIQKKAIDDPPPGITRRNFVYLVAFGAAPATALGMGVHGSLTRHELRVRDYRLFIPGLPLGLEDFTIAHVSDLHSGIFCGPERLRIICDATNDLKADLIAVTGDIINNNIDEFADALLILQKMEAPYGLHICEGNHDLLAGPGVIAQACLEHHLAWLYNSCAAISVNGERLLLAGLPWMNRGFEGHTEIVSSLFPARQDTDLRILMAHHPHLFDIAGSADLVLSGHTHGGQIMASEKVGLGPMFFKYWSGLYHRDQTSMIVSNGCGDWFPCRIGAPAEIGLLRLTGTKVSA